MDLLQQIKEKIQSNPGWHSAKGIDAVVTHIELAERHHSRAKSDRDEHLFTDAIYRTNHAFEGILKEAYILLAGQSADRKTPYEIEDYFLSSSVLRPRVVDQLKNYRQNWRNPSTHDYQLFFSEQESFLAIVSVSAFASILLDQMLDKIAYIEKYNALETAAVPARNRISGFESLSLINKVWRLLSSFADHYLANFPEMSSYSRSVTIAQLAAFLERVAPELVIQQEVFEFSESGITVFDLIVKDQNSRVAVEVREPIKNDEEKHDFIDVALVQFESYLRRGGIPSGVLFFPPGRQNEVPIATTGSSKWPKDLSLCVVYGEDKDEVESWDAHENPISLVTSDNINEYS